MTEHRTKVEDDRTTRFGQPLPPVRVVCLDCPWFFYSAEATPDVLRERGRQHTYATRGY